MAGVVQIPWYATMFRGDKFAEALREIAPVAMRYGATEYQVYRSRDDMYKFMQMTTFGDHAAFEAYWYGSEFSWWRSVHQGWYQVPILYTWADLIISGRLDEAPVSITGAPTEGDTI
jgi:hypothetical protein